jgi:hypothetical protein
MSIGNFVFNLCTSLKCVEIQLGTEPLKLGYNTMTAGGVGRGLFYDCPLEEVFIGRNLNYQALAVVGDSPFCGRTKLTSVVISEGVTVLNDQIFRGCSGLTFITIPESVTKIGDGAFADCSNLRSVTIPSDVTSIGKSAFSGCSSFSDITIPASVTSIGNNAFDGCVSLKKVVFENGSEPLDLGYGGEGWIALLNSRLLFEGLFQDCPVETLYMGRNVEYEFQSGKYYATETCSPFYNQANLSSVVIGDKVSLIWKWLFYGCTGITSITSKAEIPPAITDATTFYGVDKSIPVYVPAASLDDYKAAEYWKDFFNILPIKRETIVDGEDFEHGQDELFDEITYTRTFNNTNWQALYVPFEIPVTAELLADLEVAYINNVHQRDYDDDGVTEQTEVEAFKITKGTLRANYPYLIRAKEAGKKIITVTNTTLYATEENSIDCASVFISYTFTGTYKRL